MRSGLRRRKRILVTWTATPAAKQDIMQVSAQQGRRQAMKSLRRDLHISLPMQIFFRLTI